MCCGAGHPTQEHLTTSGSSLAKTWHSNNSLKTCIGSPLVLATLHQAFATGRTPTIFHSDQGTEFMAQRCTDYLEAHGAQISVSDVASPWQNGYIESFYERFKHELGDLNRFETAGEMIETIYRHIHYYTSQSHPHGSHDAACRLYCMNVLRHLSL